MVRNRTLACMLFPILSCVAMGQVSHSKNVAKSSLPADAGGYKAIFEPVNYGQDINLTDVFFVSPEVGWVAGEHATILKTTDGGTHWTVQVGGDMNANEKSIGNLKFLDANHGWAIQEGPVLLRTVDGENWEQVTGSFPGGVQVLDYTFTTPRHGIMLGSNGDAFYLSNDGGQHWTQVAPCQFTATVQGLAQKQYCSLLQLQMLSPTSGYSVASWRSPEAPNAASIVLFRTDDAGEHWAPILPELRDCCGPEGFFTDLNHGVIVFNNGKTYVTSDGGQNWRALLSGSVGLTSGGRTPPLRFADPEVGWVLGASPDNSDTFRISYSNDGGQHWKMSQNIGFPGGRLTELKFTFPRRDRAYVIGQHGMIYRYRLVPETYTAARILTAPMMPIFDTAPVTAASARISSDIQKLQAKLASAGAPQSPPMATPGQAPLDATAAASTGGFVQDADSTPPSAALQGCCGSSLQDFQADLSSFAQVAPATATKYRNLNLAIAGFQLVANLANQTSTLRQSFSLLKHASSLQAASAILQQLTSTVNSVQQAVSTGFQDTGAWYVSAANSGNFAQSGTTLATPPGSPPPAQTGGFQQDVPAAPANPPATQAGAPPQLQALQQKKKSKWHLPDLNAIPIPH